MRVNSLGDISRIVKKRRKDVNMSQRTLMKKSSVGHATISRFEGGETDIVFRSLLKILNALDLEIEINEKNDGSKD